MSDDSSAAGYLAPIESLADYDDAFINFMQETVVGITGLERTYARPRWQKIPPQWPQFETDWISIGLAEEADLNLAGQTRHDPTGDGSDIVRRTVADRLMISCYGPHGWGNAGLLCDGILVEQNRAALQSAGVGIASLSPRRNVPELINDRWLPRIDLVLTVNRELTRVYPVLNLLSAQGVVHALPPGKTVPIDTPFDTDDYYAGA